MATLEVIKEENIYLTEEWKVETQPPSGESPSISLGQSFYDFISLEDKKELEFRYNEIEQLSLEELKFIKVMLTKKDEVNIEDSKKLKFIMLKSEAPITLIDSSFETAKELYYNWFFDKPLNENFTFKEDSNVDGLADSLEVENGTYSIVKEDYRPHIQKLELTNGRAKLTIDIPNSLRTANSFYLYFNIKMLSGKVDVDVNVYYDDVKLSQAWHQHFIAGENNYEWIERCLKFLIYRIPYFNRIKIEFYGTASFYIDNVLITKNKSFFRNPETFSLEDNKETIEIENLINEKTIYFFFKGKKSNNIRLYWAVINRNALKFLKNLFNKFVLFRTHDRKIIVGKIIDMEVEYIKRTKKPILSLNLTIQTI